MTRSTHSAVPVILMNLQARVIRIEKELQIHDATRKKQTERNDGLIEQIKADNRHISQLPDPYV